MAINYLSAIDLNQNELKKARIENVSGTSGVPGVEGQLIYDSAADDLKLYADGNWSTLLRGGSGDVVETLTAGNGIDNTGTASDPVINVRYTESSSGAQNNIIQAAPTNAGSISGNSQILLNRSTGGTTSAASKVGLSEIPISSFGTGTSAINMGSNRILAVGAPVANSDAATKFYVDNSDTGVASINEGNGIDVTNGSGSSPTIAVKYGAASDNLIHAATTTTSFSITEPYADYILKSQANPGTANGAVEKIRSSDIPLNAFGESTASIDMGGNVIQDLGNPVIASDAANKLYVDQALTSSLKFQGGYDATAAPPTGSSVGKGFVYAVTVAGDGNGFWSTTLRPGDMIFSNQFNPLDEDDWTEVQSNLDYATAGTDATAARGIAGFNSNNFTVSASGFVAAKLATSSTTGVARVTAGDGLEIESVNSGTFTVGIDTAAGANPNSFHSDLTGQNTNIIRLESGGVTKFSVALGDAKSWSLAKGESAIVQIIDSSTGAIAYTDTSIASASHINGSTSGSPYVNLTFNGSVANNDYKISVMATL